MVLELRALERAVAFGNHCRINYQKSPAPLHGKDRHRV